MLTPRAGPDTDGPDPDADVRGVWADTFGCSISGMFTPNSSLGDACQSNCLDDPDNRTPAQPYQTPYWGRWANGARSRHPGGVNLTRADGSVHFAADSVDLAVWQASFSMDGGGIVDGE